MIKYSLICPKSHGFEGWFASSKAYDAQVKKKQVTCPICGSANVAKAMMAPSVVTSEQKAARRRRLPDTESPATQPAEPQSQQLVASPEQRAMLKELRKLRDAVLAKSEYVGPRFAEEARRIHNEGESEKGSGGGKKSKGAKGAKEPRGIHGEASPSEVKSLIEDGIEIYPVPVLPDDKN